MNAKIIFILLSSAYLLASCGGQSSSSKYYPPTESSSSYRPTQTSSYVPPSITSQHSSGNDKQAVIDYLKTWGTKSGTSYGILVSAPYGNGYTVTDAIMYDTSDDTFMSTVSLDYSSSYGSIHNFAGFAFSWGQLRYSNFLGSTTYTVSSGSSSQNSFVYTVTFSSYPNFQVTSYRATRSGSSSSIESDAELVATCLGRAINNTVNTFPSMGYSGNLW